MQPDCNLRDCNDPCNLLRILPIMYIPFYLWISRIFQNSQRKPRPNRRRRFLDVENLEDRLTPVGGTWTALSNLAPNALGTMELLTNGNVLAQEAGTTAKWDILTPSATGSYVNGTWSAAGSMNVQRLYTGTQVLKTGQVFVIGGEYASDHSFSNTAEIYDPTTNKWTMVASYPTSNFGDDPSFLLPNGKVLLGDIVDAGTHIYDPTTNTYSTGPTRLYGDRSDEECWVELPDGNILSYNIFGHAAGDTQDAQQLNVQTMNWEAAGSVPVALANSIAELGPGMLLPNGTVFQIGATSN